MAEKIATGICLFYQQIRENEFAVHILFNSGVRSFFAQGLTKPLSKNRSNLISGSICEIEYFGSRMQNTMGRLKKSNLLKMPDIENFGNKKTITRLIELFFTIKEKNDLLSLYEQFIDKFGQGRNSFILSIFLARCTVFLSFAPNFKNCVVCKSDQNIVQFDLNEGGFLCNEHKVELNYESFVSVNEWYLLFNEPMNYFDIVQKNQNIEILNRLLSFYNENGYKFNW